MKTNTRHLLQVDLKDAATKKAVRKQAAKQGETASGFARRLLMAEVNKANESNPGCDQ